MEIYLLDNDCKRNEKRLNEYCDAIEKGDKVNQPNLLSVINFIYDLRRGNYNSDLIDKNIYKLFSKVGVYEQFFTISDEHLKTIFRTRESQVLLLKDIIEYNTNKIYGENSSFYDYEYCIEEMCKYCKLFDRVDDLKKDFLDLLYSCVRFCGEPGDAALAYKGLQKIQENFRYLNKNLVLDLLNIIWEKGQVGKDTQKQVFTVINYSNFTADEKERLKFYYIDGFIFHYWFGPVVVEKIREQFKDYIDCGKDHFYDIKNREENVKNLIGKYDMNNTLRFYIKNAEFSDIEYCIDSNTLTYNLITIKFNSKLSIINVITDNKVILNIPYEFSYTGFHLDKNDYDFICDSIKKSFDIISKKGQSDEEVFESQVTDTQGDIKRIGAFISYSWDNNEHQKWVRSFTNNLRNKGIDAKIDTFITQTHTVNLNVMMNDNICNNDFVIVILTKRYAERANKHDGGVGFECDQLANFVANNKDKILLIKREQGADDEIIPNLFKGIRYYDFTEESKYKDSMKEVIYRIYGKQLYKVSPLGPIPNLEPIE